MVNPNGAELVLPHPTIVDNVSTAYYGPDAVFYGAVNALSHLPEIGSVDVVDSDLLSDDDFETIQKALTDTRRKEWALLGPEGLTAYASGMMEFAEGIEPDVAIDKVVERYSHKHDISAFAIRMMLITDPRLITTETEADKLHILSLKSAWGNTPLSHGLSVVETPDKFVPDHKFDRIFRDAEVGSFEDELESSRQISLAVLPLLQ